LPLIDTSDYLPPLLYRNNHLGTSLPTTLRRIPSLPMIRQRFDTPDGDFIDLDCWWQPEGLSVQGETPTVVLCHGLEGNAQRQYMQGMARRFGQGGCNVVGYNYRGCSGQTNRQPYSYHSGATDDLRLVLDQVHRSERPVRALIGFSLGGNLILKYLGEDSESVLPTLKAAVTFSVPIDLRACSIQLMRPENSLYQWRFKRKLAAKVREKAVLFPEQVDPGHLKQARTLWDFDEYYTGPLSGFADAEDYYRQCSSRQFLAKINLPTLLVSAQNDTFLPKECYPRQEATESAFFHLEVPAHGGHVGFHLPGGTYWSEQRAWEFVQAQTPASLPAG